MRMALYVPRASLPGFLKPVLRLPSLIERRTGRSVHVPANTSEEQTTYHFFNHSVSFSTVVLLPQICDMDVGAYLVVQSWELDGGGGFLEEEA